MSDYAGYIYFNVEEARNYLLKKSYVYTIRKPRMTGWGYAKWGRKTIAKVQIKKIDTWLNAKDYWFDSGFNSEEAWLEAVGKMDYNLMEISSLIIYRVNIKERINQ